MIDRIRLIRAIDALVDAEHLIEAAFMAAHALTREECGPMQAVIGQAGKKIEKCKARLYAIHEGAKGGDE